MKRTLIAFISIFALAACGGSSGGGGGGSATGGGTTDPGTIPAGDTATGAYIITDPDTPPAITGVVPAPGAESVSTGTAVMVTFSKMIDPETVTGVSLKTSGGTSVISDLGTTGIGVVVDPVEELDPFSEYTVVVSGIIDTHGNPLPSNFDWSFTTGGQADTDKPAITYAVPAADEPAADIGADMVIGFSEPMNPATVENAIKLAAGSRFINGTTTVDADGRTARFTPDTPLEFSTTHTLIVDTTAEDLSGNPLADGTAHLFKAGSDITNPVVLGTPGTDGYMNMAADSRGRSAFFAYADDGGFGEDGTATRVYVIGSYDAHYRLQWANLLESTNNIGYSALAIGSDDAVFVAVTMNDNVIMNGSEDTITGRDILLFAHEPDGALRYMKRIQVENTDFLRCVMDTNATTVYLGCEIDGTLPGETDNGNDDIGVISVNAATGAVQQYHQLGSTGDDWIGDIMVQPDRIAVYGFVAGSYAGSTYTAPWDTFLSELHLDLRNAHLNDRTFNNAQQFTPRAIAMRGPDNYALFSTYQVSTTHYLGFRQLGFDAVFSSLGSTPLSGGFPVLGAVARKGNVFGLALQTGPDTELFMLRDTLEQRTFTASSFSGTTDFDATTLTIDHKGRYNIGFQMEPDNRPYNRTPIGTLDHVLVPLDALGADR